MKDFFTLNKTCSVNGEILRFMFVFPNQLGFLCDKEKIKTDAGTPAFEFRIERYHHMSAGLKRCLNTFKTYHGDYNNLTKFDDKLARTCIGEIFESRVAELNISYNSFNKDFVDMTDKDTQYKVCIFLNHLLFILFALELEFDFLECFTCAIVTFIYNIRYL